MINPDQLTLFERAEDLVDPEKTFHYDFSGDPYGEEDEYYEHESFPDFRRRKITESKEGGEATTRLASSNGRSLYESVKQEGVKEPVRLAHIKDLYGMIPSGLPPKALMDGNHRVFSQDDIDPKAWVSVRWD